MNRRQSLIALSALAGHACFPEVLARFGRALAAPGEPWAPVLVTPDEGAVLAAAVDTILPDTDTPGARRAGVHVFVDLLVKHCRTADEQRAFAAGLDALEAASRARHGRSFADQAREAREAQLLALETAKDPFFAALKEATVLGYCTSETGATQALAYAHVPGDYRGCLPLAPGQKGWATW
ncbi:MAG: gluconate 2-dehydrogenase subunit 3 family protein [Vicinamibacteria bacterium]